MKIKYVTLVVVVLAILVGVAYLFMQKPKSTTNQPPANTDNSKNTVLSYSLSGTISKVSASSLTLDTFKVTKTGDTANVETDTKQILFNSQTKVFVIKDGKEVASDIKNLKVGSSISIVSDKPLTETPIIATKIDITK